MEKIRAGARSGARSEDKEERERKSWDEKRAERERKGGRPASTKRRRHYDATNTQRRSAAATTTALPAACITHLVHSVMAVNPAPLLLADLAPSAAACRGVRTRWPALQLPLPVKK
jgi:hypothetical protein